jgi:hypothetical protein
MIDNNIKVAIPFISILLLLFNSCDSPTEFVNNPSVGRRDYVWTIDTLNATDNHYFDLWGSSPTDLWTVSGSNWEKSIFHYDGKKWSSSQVTGLFNLKGLHGFSADNIFVGADAGSVWNYNGNTWNFSVKLQKEGAEYIVIQKIWGESPYDIYAVGGAPDSEGGFNNSVISHFQNNKWTMLNTGDITGLVGNLYKNKSDGRIFLNTYRTGKGLYRDSTLIYEYTRGMFKQLYSSVWNKGTQADLSYIDGEVYFVLGNVITKRINNEFKTVLEVNTSDFYQRIWGRNSKDIFLLMTDGLAHFNGIDLEYLFYFNVTPATQIYGAALFKNDAYFLVYEYKTRQKLVYHGKLN